MSRDRTGVRSSFDWFLHSEVSGSLVLLACTVLALAWANSPWAPVYERLLHTPIGISWADASFRLSLHAWINDGLMVVFFFVVGLEIKRELVVGHLSSLDKAVLPVAAAAGGMIGPAIVYAALNAGGPGLHGWGVPMATDIAFALGALAVLGSRVPVGLKVFLAALAIADDLGAVLVIALFYTSKIHLGGLVAALVFLLLLLLAIRFQVRRLGILILLILGVWAGVFVSGIHATVAGILVALVVPVRARLDPREGIATARAGLDEMEGGDLSRQSMVNDHRQLDAIRQVYDAGRQMLPAGLRLEHYLHPVQVWTILPLFALANAGVRIDERVLTTLAHPIALGVTLGLVLGKPIGIVLTSWLVVRSGKGRLPEGVTWRHIVGAGCLGGIGFTMSLFVADLAFADETMIGRAKIGILAASLIAAVVGLLVLARSGTHETDAST